MHVHVCVAGRFAPGVDPVTGRYSVLGTFPAVDSLHKAMHEYHSRSEVRRLTYRQHTVPLCALEHPGSPRPLFTLDILAPVMMKAVHSLVVSAESKLSHFAL